MNPSLPKNPANSDYNNMSLRRPIEYPHNLRLNSLGIPNFHTVHTNAINSDSLSNSFHNLLAHGNVPMQEAIPDTPTPISNDIIPPRVAPPPSSTVAPNAQPPNNAVNPNVSPFPSNTLPTKIAPVPPRFTPIPNNITTQNTDDVKSQSNCETRPSPCQRCNQPSGPAKQRALIREDMRKQAALPSYNDNVEVPMNQSHIPMAVPLMPLYGYDNCEDADKDWDYMRQMFPVCAKKIMIEIDEECDKLEYDGSCMFDEYPDRVYLGRILDRIYDKCRHLEDKPSRRSPIPTPFQEEGEEGMEVIPYQNRGYRRPSNRGNQSNPHTRQEPWLKNLIEILLYNEMLHRRRRYRGRKRWF